jgi:hypothetical protein
MAVHRGVKCLAATLILLWQASSSSSRECKIRDFASVHPNLIAITRDFDPLVVVTRAKHHKLWRKFPSRLTSHPFHFTKSEPRKLIAWNPNGSQPLAGGRVAERRHPRIMWHAPIPEPGGFAASRHVQRITTYHMPKCESIEQTEKLRPPRPSPSPGLAAPPLDCPIPGVQPAVRYCLTREMISAPVSPKIQA